MKVSLGKMSLWSLYAAVHLAKDGSLEFMIKQGCGAKTEIEKAREHR